jgi:hypothetical protein
MSDTTTTIPDSDFADIQADAQTGEVIDAEDTSTDAGSLVVQDAIKRLQSGDVGVYSTIVGDDFEAKKAVLSAVTNSAPLAEHVGEHIDLVNVVVQATELNERDNAGHETGRKITVPRTILIDANGTAYYSFSPLVLRSLQTFFGVLGQPHEWPEPVGMKVLRKKARIGSFYDCILDGKAATKK